MGEEQAQTKRSIRTNVVITMSVGFLVMFILLYFVFSMSMQTMLAEREYESMESQVNLARNVIRSSVDLIPNVTQDWSYWDNMYNYATGESDEVFHTHLDGSYAFDMFKLNIMTVIGAEGEVIFERFYNNHEQEYIDVDADLSGIYAHLTEDIKSEYRDDLEDFGALGASGFLSQGGEIYYMSAKPILHSGLEEQRMGPVAGIFIFGRILDEQTLSAMVQDAGVDFTVIDVQQLSLTDEERETLAETDSLMRVTGGNAAVYGGFPDIFGEETLLVSIESPRVIYDQGQSFITLVVLFVALGCLLVLLAIINLVDRIVLNPVGALAFAVNRIDMDNVNQGLWVQYNNKEMSDLTDAINGMLQRIKRDRDLIRQSNESLFYNANYDTLTGLRNRNNVHRMLQTSIDNARQLEQHVTVYYFDLDRFKFVNDTMGHQMGDSLIIQIADRMRAKLGVGAQIARMGGDEFMVCLDDFGSEEQREAFAEKICAIFADPFMIKERELDISASVGSSVYPEDGQDVDTIIKNAELAMYRAKDMGEHAYIPYKREFHNTLQRRIDIENKLRRVINAGYGEFQPYFQPKVSIGTGKIERCEALIRWNAPGGLIGPMEFIPQAEESGLIIPLTRWMVRECCRQGKRFEENGTPMSIAINVSAQVLMHDDFLQMIREATEDSGFDLHRLDIEITEGTLLEDMEKVNAVFGALHEMGVEISVDDFGTGYSSLSYLNRLAVDRIKVDRSFVSGIGKDEDSRAIVSAIIAMAKSLKMVVTAEGVEDEEQYGFLRGVECEEAQGFLISRPLPADQYIEFLNGWDSGEVLGDDVGRDRESGI